MNQTVDANKLLEFLLRWRTRLCAKKELDLEQFGTLATLNTIIWWLDDPYHRIQELKE